MKKIIVILSALLSTAALAQSMPQSIMPNKELPKTSGILTSNAGFSVINNSEKYTMEIEYAARPEGSDECTKKVITIPNKGSAHLDRACAVMKVIEKDINNQIIHTAQFDETYGCQPIYGFFESNAASAVIIANAYSEDVITCTPTNIGIK